MAGPGALVDTNILAELSRPRPNPGVEAWARATSLVAISVITVEEVLFGLARKPTARARAWFDCFLERHCEVLDVNRAIAALAGTLRVSSRPAVKCGRKRTCSSRPPPPTMG